MKNIKLSFSGLLTALISQAPRVALAASEHQGKVQKLTTTIRLEEPVRLFYEAQASNLGVSIQECLSMTLHAVMRASCEPQASELEQQADRFFELFAAHDIPMTDIPDLIKSASSLEREDLLSKGKVLNKYDSELVAHLGKLFNVSESWIKGLKTNSHNSHAVLYKNSNGFVRYLAFLKHHHRSVKLYFVVKKDRVKNDTYGALKNASRLEDTIESIDISVLIEIEKTVEDVSFRTFEVINEQLRWNYGKCRRDLKAVMMFCDRVRIHFNGIIIGNDSYESLFFGQALAASTLKGNYRIWQPDQLVWNDERNTELHELHSITNHYNSNKLDECEIAVRQSGKIKDWNKFLSGDEILPSDS